MNPADMEIGMVVGRLAAQGIDASRSPDPAEWRLAVTAHPLHVPRIALGEAGFEVYRPLTRLRRRIGPRAKRHTLVVPVFGSYLFVNVAGADVAHACAVTHDGAPVIGRFVDCGGTTRVPTASVERLRLDWDAPRNDGGPDFPPLQIGQSVRMRPGCAMEGLIGQVMGMRDGAVRVTLSFFGTTITATVPRGLLLNGEAG